MFDFVNFVLLFRVANATRVSINIPTLNRGFIRNMGLNYRSRIAMANLGRKVVFASISLALLGVFVGFGQATMAMFTLQGGGEQNHPINLIVEDRVLIQYKLVGGNVSAMQFSISFPDGTVRDFGGSGDFSHSFICDVEGEYVLHFVNTDQTEEIYVTLNYEVQHYIFGIPQMLFMVILIAVVSIVGVAVFIGLSRKP